MDSLVLVTDLISFIDQHRGNKDEKRSLAEKMIESNVEYRAQFDRNSKTFHKGISTVVPVGGSRVPESMKKTISNVSATSPAPASYGPKYDTLMEERKSLTLLKKKISLACGALGSRKMIAGFKIADNSLRELENMYASFPKEGEWGSIISQIIVMAKLPLATSKKKLSKLSIQVNRKLGARLRAQLVEIKKIKKNFKVKPVSNVSMTSTKDKTKCSLSDLEILTHSVVANIGEAALGKKKITFSKNGMDGLLACSEDFVKTTPLYGARISCSLPMTTHTGVLIEILTRLGARVRLCSCDIPSAQDYVAAAVAATNVSVFAWKDQSLEEYWWCMYQCLSWEKSEGPNMILDHGGDVIFLIHEGMKAELNFKKDGSLPNPNATKDPKRKIVFSLLQNTIKKNPVKFTSMASGILGLSEGSAMGVHQLMQMLKNGTLPFPAINVNDSLTNNRFATRYGCRHSLPDGVMRATDVMIAGKRVLICGFGDVGKGCAQTMLAAGARVFISEIDPICALQAVMDGMNIKPLEDLVNDIDIVITATGSKGVVKASDMAKMKNNCIIGNMGNFEDEIDLAGLAKVPGIQEKMIKPGCHRWEFPDGHGVIILGEGHPLNLECSTGHPSVVMSCIYTNQLLAQLELWNKRRTATKKGEYTNQIHVIPKALDEKVARYHVQKIGGNLTELSKEQADYIGVEVSGPYKPIAYRY